ncbi:MAG: hypothetical protein NTX00_04815 [Candidatus Parcubacteria bacterium]|nr:hypothetical protein [Candidatus Parcubacteria bacterium]
MLKKKIKKNKKVKKSSKQKTSKAKKKAALGRKIEIKDLSQPEPENVLGAVFYPAENENNLVNLDIADLDSEEDVLENTNSSQLPDLDSLATEAEAEIMPDSANEFEEQDNFENYEADKASGNLTLRQKHIILYIGLTSVMAVILVFWFFSVKQSLSQTLKYTNKQSPTGEEQKLQQGLDQIKGDFLNVTNKIQAQQNTINDFSAQAVTQIKEQQFKNAILNKVKDNLNQANININQNQNSNINSAKP